MTIRLAFQCAPQPDAADRRERARVRAPRNIDWHGKITISGVFQFLQELGQKELCLSEGERTITRDLSRKIQRCGMIHADTGMRLRA